MGRKSATSSRAVLSGAPSPPRTQLRNAAIVKIGSTASKDRSHRYGSVLTPPPTAGATTTRIKECGRWGYPSRRRGGSEDWRFNSPVSFETRACASYHVRIRSGSSMGPRSNRLALDGNNRSRIEVELHGCA